MSDWPETASRGSVRLQDGQPKEVVRKCTAKGNEVVEVNSFKFIRKRKPAEVQLKYVDDISDIGANVNVPAAGPVVEPEVGSHELLEKTLVAPPAALHCGTSDHGEEPCEHNVASPLASMAAGSDEADGQRRSARERDLVADVGSLLAFIPSECPAAVSVTWLLREALRMAVQPGDSDGTAAAVGVMRSFQQGLDQYAVSAKQLLKGGTEQMQQFDRLPPMVRGMCSRERLVASIRQQLAALEHEEKTWLALEAKYREDCADPGVKETLSHDEAQVVPSGVILEAQKRVDVEPLVVAHRQADLQLGFQVEAVNSMLGKAERLVAQAQQACSLLQADYHKENFQSYLHINSPQVLVKILSQAVPNAITDFVPSLQPNQG